MKDLIKNILSSNKKYIVLSLLASFVLDFFSLILLLITGASKAAVFMVLLLACDLSFTFIFSLSNPRFKYTLKEHAVHEIISLILILLISIIYFFNAKRRAMTFLGFVVFFLIRLIIYGLPGRCLLLSRNEEKYTKKGQLKNATLLSFVVLIIGIVLNVLLGVFGQGAFASNLVYTYNSSNKTYTVTDTLSNSKGKITIPEKFNSKDVMYISLDLLSKEKITEINIKSNGLVKLTNYTNLNSINTDIKIYGSVNAIDSIKKDILDNFQKDRDKDSKLYKDILNMFVVKDDSVKYVSYEYSSELIESTGGLFIPTLILNDNEEINLNDSLIDIFKHSNEESIDDLKWALEENGGYIIRDITDNRGSSLLNSRISESINDASIILDKVYKINLETGNFEKTSKLDDSFKDLYVTKTSGESLIQTIENAKNGGFKIVSLKDSKGSVITDLGEYLEKEQEENTITLIPEWEMCAPEIIESISNGMVTPGEAINVSINAVLADMSIDTEWFYTPYSVNSSSDTSTMSPVSTIETNKGSIETSYSTNSTRKTGNYVLKITIKMSGTALTYETLLIYGIRG